MQYDKRQHGHWVKMLGDDLADIQHFRRPENNEHIAVTVLQDGSCFVGRSVCSRKDQYVKKIGFNIAVGRSLAKTVILCKMFEPPDFYVSLTSLRNGNGNALRDDLRSRLGLLVREHKLTFTP